MTMVRSGDPQAGQTVTVRIYRVLWLVPSDIRDNA